ncbi:MAG: hypothetical protein HFJ10_01995 [Lachnospiraceae bacterium]|nr:hypothetical protein [Lachnospiraceae bacterium]
MYKVREDAKEGSYALCMSMEVTIQTLQKTQGASIDTAAPFIRTVTDPVHLPVIP